MNLRERLFSPRGTLAADVSLKESSWFKVGGTAEILFTPADEDDLAQFLKHTPADIPVTVLGLASNVIIRDGGIKGVVIKLGAAFRQINVRENIIHVGAAAVDALVARTALAHSLTGLEFLSGIPGSIGGGLRMNAGAYDREFKDVVVDVRGVDRQGHIQMFNNASMGFSYRHCGVADDVIFTSATLQATKGDPTVIEERMKNIQAARGATQPIKSYTGGSTFANPDGQKAWRLIDAAGCRGLRMGGAEVSTQHCNFLINTGTATAADLETLGNTVRERVKASSGIELRWEIRRIGFEIQK